MRINLDTFQSLLECKGHASTDDESVYFSDKVINQLNLVRHFSAAEDSQKRTFGLFEGFCKVFELLLHEKPTGTLREVHSYHGRVSTMSSAESIIYNIRVCQKLTDTDVDIGKRCERFSELFHIFWIGFYLLAFFILAAALLLNMEAKVFKKDNLTYIRTLTSQGVPSFCSETLFSTSGPTQS